jgi:hypothetical protein
MTEESGWRVYPNPLRGWRYTAYREATEWLGCADCAGLTDDGVGIGEARYPGWAPYTS